MIDLWPYSPHTHAAIPAPCPNRTRHLCPIAPVTRYQCWAFMKRFASESEHNSELGHGAGGLILISRGLASVWERAFTAQGAKRLNHSTHHFHWGGALSNSACLCRVSMRPTAVRWGEPGRTCTGGGRCTHSVFKMFACYVHKESAVRVSAGTTSPASRAVSSKLCPPPPATRPAQNTFRVLLCAALALNATGQYRVSLSLR